jgi:hypothetical protein
MQTSDSFDMLPSQCLKKTRCVPNKSAMIGKRSPYVHSFVTFLYAYYILTFLTHLNTAELLGTRTIHHSDACDGPICRGVESVLNRFWWFWWAKWSKATFLIGFKPTTLNAVIHCKRSKAAAPTMSWQSVICMPIITHRYHGHSRARVLSLGNDRMTEFFHTPRPWQQPTSSGVSRKVNWQPRTRKETDPKHSLTVNKLGWACLWL